MDLPLGNISWKRALVPGTCRNNLDFCENRETAWEKLATTKLYPALRRIRDDVHLAVFNSKF